MWITIELDIRDDESGEPGYEAMDVDSYEVLDSGVLKVEYQKRLKHYSPGYWCTVEVDTLSHEEREKYNAEQDAEFNQQLGGAMADTSSDASAPAEPNAREKLQGLRGATARPTGRPRPHPRGYGSGV